jgi:hypothetical protein
MKIIPARPRLRRHRHAPCDRQDILRKRVWIGIGRELAAGFEALNRLRNSAKLDAWIANAKASLVSSFATGVLRDIAAVRAAITQPWSNDQVEGRLRTSHSSNDKCMGANMRQSQFCKQNDAYHIEVNW